MKQETKSEIRKLEPKTGRVLKKAKTAARRRLVMGKISQALTFKEPPKPVEQKTDTVRQKRKTPRYEITSQGTGHGNYTRYHALRNSGLASVWEDIRMKTILDNLELNEVPKVLDLGCNEGMFSLIFGLRAKAGKLVGIDIDERLIENANRNLDKVSKKMAYKPIELGIAFCSRAESGEHTMIESDWKTTVEFLQGDIVQLMQTEEFRESSKNQYDVICCLSLTKWIHLNHGDDTMKELFCFIFNSLAENGYLVLEFQPWRTYKKKKYTEEQMENRKNIQFHPGQFPKYLNNLGLTTVFSGSIPSANGPIVRPLHIFQKKTTE